MVTISAFFPASGLFSLKFLNCCVGCVWFVVAAWGDEDHVKINRRLYREKFDAVAPILGSKISVQIPPAGFYLWPDLGQDDLDFCRRAFSEQNVSLLPGQFLAREVDGHNPGTGRVRLALVAELEECIEGAERLATII